MCLSGWYSGQAILLVTRPGLESKLEAWDGSMSCSDGRSNRYSAVLSACCM